MFAPNSNCVAHKIVSTLGVSADEKDLAACVIGLCLCHQLVTFMTIMTICQKSALHFLLCKRQWVHFLQPSMDLLLKFGRAFLSQCSHHFEWFVVHLIETCVHLQGHTACQHVLHHVQNAVKFGGFQPHSDLPAADFLNQLHDALLLFGAMLDILHVHCGNVEPFNPLKQGPQQHDPVHDGVWISKMNWLFEHLLSLSRLDCDQENQHDAGVLFGHQSAPANATGELGFGQIPVALSAQQ